MKKYLYLFSKKWLLLVGILLFLMLASCNKDVLKETPLDFLAPENSYKTFGGIQQGMAAIHAMVRDNWTAASWQEYIRFGLGTDIAFYGDDPGSSRYLCNYETSVLPGNSSLWPLWQWPYQYIQMANTLIQSINTSDDAIWASDAQKKSYLAEAMFFRAFSYRILVSFFGDVPLVTETIKSAKTDFVRAAKEDIYNLMEEDLTFGTVNLPEPGMEEAPGKITQGAAWHMLSELYLTEGKYQLAVDAASNVIEKYHYALMTKRFGTNLGKDIFGSGDVYYDLFRYGNQNIAENTEAIWVMQLEPIIVGGGSFYGEGSFGPAYFRIGNTPDGKKAIRGTFYNGVYTGYSDTLGRSVGHIRPTNYTSYNIWRSDWNKDIRNAKHNIKRNFYYDSPGSAYDKKKIDFSLYKPGTRDPLRDTNQYIYPYWIKVADPCHHFTDPDKSGNGKTHIDLYAIRLAETLLLRAEAYVRLNNLNAAANDINQIRNRAKATPVLPADVNLDYILDERARELYAEEWRCIVLRRMDKLLERVRKYNNNPVFPGNNIQDHNVLFPIPQNVIDLNIDAEMQQNPGY